MTRVLPVTLLLVLCCFVLLAECRTTSQLRVSDEKHPKEVSYVVDDDEDRNGDEGRFLLGSGTGGSSSAAINNLITQKQQMLESLRPTGSFSGTSTGAANVIYVNAGATSGTATATATATATGGAAGGGSVAGILLPQVIGAALSGNTRRRRPSNSNRNRNRKRKVNGNANANRNRKHKRPQVYLIRP